MPRGSKPGERRGGRKKGTPNKTTADIKAAFRKHGPELVKALLALTKSTDEQVRLKAIQACLDRGWGRPVQAVEAPDGGQAVVAIERIIIRPQDRLVHSGPVIDQPPVNGKDHASLSPSLSPEATPRLPLDD